MNLRSKPVALGGLLTAVSVVIMSLGSLIPVNTYVCPVLCILLTRPVLEICGRRFALSYYGAVAILSLLLAPDREAALIYLFLGWYPLARPAVGRLPKVPALLVKVLLVCVSAAAAYWVMLFVLGMEAIQAEFAEMGLFAILVLMILWVVMMLLVDRLLGAPLKKRFQ